MNDKPNLEEIEPIDEARLVEILRNFQPRPGDRFYKRMENAPWTDQGRQSLGGFFAYIMRRYPIRRKLAAAGLVLLLILGLGLVFPSLQVVAQQVMLFFSPASSDQIAVQVTVPYPGDLQSQGISRDFSLSLMEVKDLAGFKVMEPVDLPDELSLAGASYDPALQSITLLYTGNQGRLLFSQRLLGEVEEYLSIGASAPVEKVWLRGTQGEYVKGGWKMGSEAERRLETSIPGTQVNLGVYWDPELPQSTLRWQEGEYVFELQWIGGVGSEKDALIRIAESIPSLRD